MKIGEVCGRVTLSRVHPALSGIRWIVVAPCSLKALLAAGERAGQTGAVRGDGEDLVDWVLSAYESDPHIPYGAVIVFGPFMSATARENFKERSAKFILEGRFPERVLEKAVQRMLPRGPLGRQQIKKLKVYAGAEHPHAAQNPTVLDIPAAKAR